MTQVTSYASERSLVDSWTTPGDGDLMPPWAYVAAAVTLFLIGFFGFFCNLFVIVLMCKDKQLWTPMNVILFNLVCSDFSVSILGNPLTLSSALAHKWIYGRAMCVIYGFFMSLLGITSITTLMVLAFERYMMISKPFRARHLSKQSAIALVFAIWLYSLVLTTPPLFGWGEYVHEAANISCSVNWESREMSATTYIIFLFSMGLVVPVFVICYSYMNIIRTLKQNSLRMGQVNKKESRVAYMIAAMIVAFLVAWTPYSILALLIAFGDPTLVNPGLAVVPALVAKSSICYNPIIYVGLNTQFRSAWRRLVGIPTRESLGSQERYHDHTGNSAPTLNITNDVTEERTKAKKLLVLMAKIPTIENQVTTEPSCPSDTTELNEMSRTLPKLSRLLKCKDSEKMSCDKMVPNGGVRKSNFMNELETYYENDEVEEMQVSQIGNDESSFAQE